MFFALLFVFELLLLFLLSRSIQLNFSQFVYSVTRSMKMTIGAISFLFLPGTFLHEMAHWLMAKILFVQTGKMSLTPQMTRDSLRLGSVAIAKTDPVRRILIGTAPVFIGLSLILGVLYFASAYTLFDNLWIVALAGYVVFETGNTMFSSKKDMEGAIELIAVVVFIAGIGYLLGLRVSMASIESFFEQELLFRVFQNGVYYLLFPILVDVIFLLILKLIRR